jgi:L-arabinokinase
VFRIVEGNSHGLSDVDRFVRQLNSHPFFEQTNDIIVTRAPGRLDVMGGIADYSGSLVLEMPIAEATFAAIQRNSKDLIELVSIQADDVSLEFKLPLADLGNIGAQSNLAATRDYFSNRLGGDWAPYVAGVFFVLAIELGIRFDSGARILIASQVPIGKGVSSSAALEIAVMQAVCVAYEIELEPRNLALLCQKVENHIVGAACGVMDQMTSHCGEAGKLIAIVCQPAEIRGHLRIPNEIEFWGIDSGVRHVVSGSDYSTVRTGAFMGYRIITDLAGLNARKIGDGVVSVNDLRWGGYLANVSPDEYESEFRENVPNSMRGDEFLARYEGFTDTVTSIDPQRTYAIKAPTEHAIFENWRVNKFADLLSGEVTDDILNEAGELMFASHLSYKACGLTESRTDRMVELVRDGSEDGLFGARITGGGSGGTVAVLARKESEKAIARMADDLANETGNRPNVFRGSSPGSSLFGHARLRFVNSQ